MPYDSTHVMVEPPKRPADSRPNGQPYYIESVCIGCGGKLVQCTESVEQGWMDEFECVDCGSLHMDWPDEVLESIEETKSKTDKFL